MRDDTRNFVDLMCCAPDCDSPSSPISIKAVPLCEQHVIRAYRAMGEHMRSKLEIEVDEQYETVWTHAYPTTPCSNIMCGGVVDQAYRRLRARPELDRKPLHRYRCSDPTCNMTLTRDVWETMHVDLSNGSLRNVVYYIRFSDRVKIGTTSNLKSRLGDLPYDELLGTEPGGLSLEQYRHEQFAQYRLVGEWFSMSPKLIQHIDALKSSTA